MIDEAYEHKKLRHSNLAVEAEDRGWRVKVRSVEVGCRGFVASSTKLLSERGVRGQAHRRAIKELDDTAERTSDQLWMKRRHCLGSQGEQLTTGDTRPGLISLWWACLSGGCLVIKG